MRYTHANKVKQGDKLGVFASSARIDYLSDKRINKAYQLIEENGYSIVEAPHCRKDINGYLAGTAKERAVEIADLVKDPKVGGLLSFWGGANTNQILDEVDFEVFKEYSKPIVGYSDTTALLQAITNLSGLVTYMGPAGVTFTKHFHFDYSWDYLKKMVLDQEEQIEYVPAEKYIDELDFDTPQEELSKKNKGPKVYKEGSCEGRVVGSNLQTLLVLAGTKYETDITDKILFLEEAEDIEIDMVHRYFSYLRQLHKFKTVRGIMLGKFMKESKVEENALRDILAELSADMEIPVVYDLDFGHTDPLFTVPNGGYAAIQTAPVEITFYRK